MPDLDSELASLTAEVVIDTTSTPTLLNCRGNIASNYRAEVVSKDVDVLG